MKTTLFLSSLLTLASLSPATGQTITTISADAFAWVETPEGVAFADLHGARFAEAYMSMVRLPGGTVSPAHVKSANMFGVVIAGTMTHVRADNTAAPTPLETGAFYLVPADLPHVSSCISATPCITFLYQDGAFDFVPVAQ